MTVTIVRVIISLVLALILGNGSVVLFNHLPQNWFAEWEPAEAEAGKAKDGTAKDETLLKRVLPQALVEADAHGRQRIPSTPWKYVFVGFFGMSGVFLAIRESTQYQLAATLVLWVVLMMAISDQLYCIVPDQFSLMLALTAVGFINFYDEWWEPLAGAGIGLALSLSVWGLGRLIYHTDSIGGADIKFYACMGLVVGRSGILIIFVLTTLCTAVQAAFKIATRTGTIRDRRAMLPCSLVATWIYLMFLWSIFDLLSF